MVRPSWRCFAPAFAAFFICARAPASENNAWKSLISAEELKSRVNDPKLLIVDVRSANEYATGHIPSAINLPGSQWRTPAMRSPSKDGIGQQIFRKADGTLDVPRYEKYLSDAGVLNEHEIVVYGNHAGRADGSVPAAILLKLGHKNVKFLDGVGLEEWKKSGGNVSREPRRLSPSKYVAKADSKRLWSYKDVLTNLNNKDVLVIDSRTPAEYSGLDLRGNLRGGHIPGAQLLNAEDFLDHQTKQTISFDAAKARVERLILDKDKTVVIYCQSGTRCSHKELLLKDLGYKNVVLYDASWQEWGNRTDTPVEKESK
jgi:thiosulfate/3-mercaptopyruvate sulfurtransferase